MRQKNISNQTTLSSNSAIELLSWPAGTAIDNIPIKYKITALQTTRYDPESLASQNCSLTNNLSPYGGFNLGLHVDDNAETVVKNRQYLQRYIDNTLTDKVDIQWLEQVHGHKVVEITSPTNKAPIADASITREKNIALAIMTADCLPILLCDRYGTEVAAIHGGWRPLAANIIKNTLAKMKSTTDDIQAWLGPCIGNNVFEVGEEVKLAFTRQNIYFAKAFVKQDNGKYLADLHIIAKQQLADLGITNVTLLTECTYKQSDKYYSYRRESITGRMATIIFLSQ